MEDVHRGAVKKSVIIPIAKVYEVFLDIDLFSSASEWDPFLLQF